ncbi:hypothetical protein CC86DRAFT_288464 [Ophiobolus disseminans]|uniref:Uncharacterized protein n=1 Tax=Ophiobolus disseminans TaxID=1469910 RepID=A0A6A7A739_9PLEO|nr:hypothetical protein CC86DRAFT_288464 [Ophiobolus disseminans]
MHPEKARTPKPRPKLRLHKTRLGLPITLDTDGLVATVLACADTGADVNIISDELARALGHTNYSVASAKKQFKLANGKIVESVGQITSSCAFGVETEFSVSMSCIFHVLMKVVTPIIMGMQFLEETETMTKHRDRLVRVPRPALQALSVCSFDRPRQLLSCSLESEAIMATPDTGSEINLMPPQLASALGLDIHSGVQLIELADGSTTRTSGYVHVALSLTDPLTEKKQVSVSATVEIHLLQELAHTLLVGEETLEELSVFTDNQSSLVSAAQMNSSFGLNTIRSLGRLEDIWSRVKGRLGGKQTGPNSEGDLTVDQSVIEDQRENDRREREARRITKLPMHEQQAATDAEFARRVQYDGQISSVLRSIVEPISVSRIPPSSASWSPNASGDISLQSGAGEIFGTHPRRTSGGIIDGQYPQMLSSAPIPSPQSRQMTVLSRQLREIIGQLPTDNPRRR